MPPRRSQTWAALSQEKRELLCERYKLSESALQTISLFVEEDFLQYIALERRGTLSREAKNGLLALSRALQALLCLPDDQLEVLAEQVDFLIPRKAADARKWIKSFDQGIWFSDVQPEDRGRPLRVNLNMERLSYGLASTWNECSGNPVSDSTGHGSSFQFFKELMRELRVAGIDGEWEDCREAARMCLAEYPAAVRRYLTRPTGIP